MGQARKLKAARRLAERAAAEIKGPKVGKYAGAKRWQRILSFVFPWILNKPRREAQAKADQLDAMARKNAIKKISHKLARG